MKLIMAIIRIKKMNATKEALAGIGLPSFMTTEVLGRGKGNKTGDQYQALKDSPEYAEASGEPRLKAKRMINLVVTDEKAQAAIDTILSVNKTGNSGDGKIFVLPINEALQLRTGNTGDKVLD